HPRPGKRSGKRRRTSRITISKMNTPISRLMSDAGSAARPQTPMGVPSTVPTSMLRIPESRKSTRSWMNTPSANGAAYSVRRTIAVAGDIRYGRKASPTRPKPKPARPSTQLPPPLAPAAAAQSDIATGFRRSPPPGIERRHVGARALREARRPLRDERVDALACVGRAARPEHSEGVEPVRLPWMIGAQQLPQHLSDQYDGDGRGVVGDLAPQRAGGRQQRVGNDDATHQASGQGFFRGGDASGQRPLGRLADADQARQE